MAWLRDFFGGTRRHEGKNLHEWIASLRERPDTYVEVVRAVHAIGPKAAVPELIKLLADSNERLREAAAEAFACINHETYGRPLGPGPRQAVQPLVERLRDSDERVRRAAGRALAEMGPVTQEAVPALIHLLADETGFVRRTAAWTLGVMEPKPIRAVPALLQRLTDSEKEVRAAAAGALSLLGSLDVLPPLIDRLADPAEGSAVLSKSARALSWVISRVGLEEVLREIGPEITRAVNSLIQRLTHYDAEVREEAAMVLGELGQASNKAVPALIECLKDSGSHVRRAAARALERIGPAAQAAILHYHCC